MAPIERTRLTRERIIAAAVVLVDRDGIDALSMRTLASEMGVGTMSLYNHVSGKDDVLDGVADAVLGEMDLRRARTGSWEDRARELAWAFRRLALAHPRSFTLVLSRRFDSPMSRGPMERSLEVLEDAGFGGETAVSILRAFMAFEVGSLLRELHPHDERRGAVADRSSDPEQVAWPADEFPHLASLSPCLERWDHEAEYDFGIELLIRSLAHLRSDGGPVARRGGKVTRR